MHEIYDAKRVRRVLIFRCDDGKWSFVKEHFGAHLFEKCWVPVRSNITISDSRATALREARSRVDWLI